MDFTPIDFTPYLMIAGFAGLGTSIFGLVWVCATDGVKKPYPKDRKPWIVIGATLSILFLLVTILSSVLAVRAGDSNKENATANILQKYNLSEVLWDARQTKVYPTDDDGDRQILVETKDEQRYIFHYRVDRETGEPTLYDMPIEGGKAPEEAVSIRSLIK